MFIMGVQCAIFERQSIANTAWSDAIAGYLVGYTLTLFILYSLTPILLRLSSAMFFNLSLLTSGMRLLKMKLIQISGVLSLELDCSGFMSTNCIL
jgi:Solute carrier family 35